jgi:hypothetical protein
MICYRTAAEEGSGSIFILKTAMNFTRVTSNGSCCWEMFGMNNGTDEIWPGDSRKLKISNILTIKSKQWCTGKGAFVGKSSNFFIEDTTHVSSYVTLPIIC